MVRQAGPGMHAVSVTAAQQLTQRTLPTLERRVDEAIHEKPEAIDLMMGAVQIVDSVALNWLLSVAGRLETLGIRLRLVDPSAVMSDVLLATRLDSRFTVDVRTGSGAVDGRAVDGRSAPVTGGPPTRPRRPPRPGRR